MPPNWLPVSTDSRRLRQPSGTRCPALPAACPALPTCHHEQQPERRTSAVPPGHVLSSCFLRGSYRPEVSSKVLGSVGDQPASWQSVRPTAAAPSWHVAAEVAAMGRGSHESRGRGSERRGAVEGQRRKTCQTGFLLRRDGPILLPREPHVRPIELTRRCRVLHPPACRKRQHGGWVDDDYGGVGAGPGVRARPDGAAGWTSLQQCPIGKLGCGWK